MSILDLFRPKWRHSNPKIRQEIIEKGQLSYDILAQISQQDPDPKIRKIAVEELIEPEILEKIVKTETNPEVISEARKRLKAPKVTFRHSKKTLLWHPKYQDLLSMAIDNDVYIYIGCRRGTDNLCQVPLISGKIHHFSKPKKYLNKGLFLPCVAIPKSDIVIGA